MQYKRLDRTGLMVSQVCLGTMTFGTQVSENNRGIPGTGLVQWTEFFKALMDIGYTGPLVIESFSPDFKEFSRNVAIWRKLANSGDEIAIEWLKNLRNIEKYNPVMPVTTGGGQNAT